MESHLAVLTGEGPPSGHRTLAEKAFQALHTAIIGGKLRPGARLPIEGLAQHMQMSPMPIREALRRLDAAGLVEHIPHRGARVSQLSVIDLAEVYEARLALELTAIRRAAGRFTTAHVETARGALEALDDMPDDSAPATTAAHETFHFALYRAAGSAWLLRLIRPVWETSERYCIEVPECRQLRTRRPEHAAIIDACAARDPERAAAALRLHLTRTANSIAVAMGGEPLYDGGASPSM